MTELRSRPRPRSRVYALNKGYTVMLHFHVKVSLEGEKEHHPQFYPHIATACPWCVSSTLPSCWNILHSQFCSLIFFTLCFSILLHGFYSHHFNDLHNIPLLGRCWVEFSVLPLKILGEFLGTPAVSPTVLPGLITSFSFYDFSEMVQI